MAIVDIKVKSKMNMDLLKRIRRMYASPYVVSVGIHENKQYKGESLGTADVARIQHFGTDKIPARPFLDVAIIKAQDKIVKHVMQVLSQDITSKKVYAIMGEQAVIAVQNYILNSGNFLPLSQKTIARKKSSKPLIDTGAMLQAINYEVRKNG